MPTKKRKITIVVDDNVAEHFDLFRFGNQIRTESKAGYQIFLAGMEALKDEYPELDLRTKLETRKKENVDGLNERPEVHP